jgi:hypothetical protein
MRSVDYLSTCVRRDEDEIAKDLPCLSRYGTCTSVTLGQYYQRGLMQPVNFLLTITANQTQAFEQPSYSLHRLSRRDVFRLS